MTYPSSFRIVHSASAAARLDAAESFLLSHPPLEPVTIVGATRGAADDLARRVARARPATIGMVRLSLVQLAARTAMLDVARRGAAPGTPLGAEAVATRATFDATRAATLDYFAPVASTPGFPRALARTIQELRLAGIGSRSLEGLPLGGRDLAELLGRFERYYADAATVDRAALLRTAASCLADRPLRGALVLLDLALDGPAEADLVRVLTAGARTTLATVPRADTHALAALTAAGGIREDVDGDEHGDLGCARRFLFEPDAAPDERPLDESLQIFSAPGEGRECVEVARRILLQARAGVPFDQMAVLIRAPHTYFGLLEHAFTRAGIPGWFDRGTRRPHAAGRAFLALLACASERLSAGRFAEYLSLGQVPKPDVETGPAWAASIDEGLGDAAGPASDELEEEATAAAGERVDADDAVLAGTLRAPWQWERLLGDASVINGDPARWRRRLGGLERQLDRQILEAGKRDGIDSARVRGLELAKTQLAYLKTFAIPVIERLAEWPREAAWGDWLDRFEALAPQVLRTPSYVLRVCADLRPMAAVGPVDLDEARRVLSERLLSLETEPPARRYGRVFVGTPQQARGRQFRVVFVPGLVERLFPAKPREDPLLLDDLRRALTTPLATQDTRLAGERLLLRLAVGAAAGQLYVSYPRIEITESRPRVPSFYALDLLRAATGRLPHHEQLEEIARRAGHATLAWPAPPAAEDAIDDQEHDLAVLRGLLDNPDPQSVRGHAHYLLSLNPCLRRSVSSRWSRGQPRWSPNDGITRVPPRLEGAIGGLRLTSRAYSLSALQKFSACPYQFVLSAVFRLQPLEQPEPLRRMDPLTRGSLFHEIQATFLRELRSRGLLPVTGATIALAGGILEETTTRISSAAYDELAPAVERVWADEVASIRRDLQGWLDHLAADGGEWLPEYFELGFGPVPGERDERSIPEDVVLPEGFRLRGAIDLVEAHRQTGVLRVTDHKTGRTPERLDRLVIGGGGVLQPVLYAMAVETALGRPVSHGRLFYCTSAGGFSSHPIPLNDVTRAAGVEVLEVIDRAIAAGFLPAAPREEACARCDFMPVCGPDVHRRTRRKPHEPLADLDALRSRP